MNFLEPVNVLGNKLPHEIGPNNWYSEVTAMLRVENNIQVGQPAAETHEVYIFHTVTWQL